jgi:RNA polymerase sigma factor (sigma-70 family)
VVRAHRQLERLYRDYGRDVYRLALRDLRNREDAEDATQAAFLNAYRALVRGDLPRKPRSWLLAIAENVCRRRFRAGAPPTHWPLDDEALEAPSNEEPLLEEIVTSLGGLSETQRSVLVLRELGDFSYAEISERVGLSVQAVQMQLFRARRRFRQELSLRRVPLVLSWLPRLLDLIRGAPAASTAIPLVAATVATGVFVAAPAPEPSAARVPAAAVPGLAAAAHTRAVHPARRATSASRRPHRVSARPHARATTEPAHRRSAPAPAPSAAPIRAAAPQPHPGPQATPPAVTRPRPAPEPPALPALPAAPRLGPTPTPPPVPAPPTTVPAPPALPVTPPAPPELPQPPKLPDPPRLPTVSPSTPTVPPPPVTEPPAPSP